MRLSPLLFRRIHKWVGLVLALQFVLWTVSGAMMALIDMEAVAGGARPAAPPAPVMPQAGTAWSAVARSLEGEAATGVAVRPLAERMVYDVATPQGPRLFDAATGAPVTIDASLAAAVARAGYAGTRPVRRISLLAEKDLAIREHALPIWRVDFADEQSTSIYVSASTGRLLERRDDSWRLWDFFWMLHNMDYANRTSFNHPLIVTLAVAAAWLAITGFYLLFRTAWRPELRWATRKLRRS